MLRGLKCALTFLGELPLSDGMACMGEETSVEKRVRVMEVFLAVLWVRDLFLILAVRVSDREQLADLKHPVSGVSICRLFLHRMLDVSLVLVYLCLAREYAETTKAFVLSPYATVIRVRTINAVITLATFYLGFVRRLGGSSSTVIYLGLNHNGKYSSTFHRDMVCSCVADPWRTVSSDAAGNQYQESNSSFRQCILYCRLC